MITDFKTKKTMQKTAIKNTKVCQEHGEGFYEKWFSGKKEKQFISHVDTLYYVVTLKLPEDEETGETVMLKDYEPWQEFILKLENVKQQAEVMHEPVSIFEDVNENLEVQPFFAAQMYSLHFGFENNYDIFVCKSTPNKDTPPIMVHIRSNALWIDGMKGIFDKSYECLETILRKFGMEIEKTQENRIDYAFHTNYFNNLLRAFPEEDFGKMFVGNFERADKQYNLHTHEENEFGDRKVECDYLTLGRRKSKNCFFRLYNKTKEVIQMGYKQFFIPIWKKHGLISDFDVFVLEKAFQYGSYESIDKARCEFYCSYGADKGIMKEIAEKLNDNTVPAKWWTKRAKSLVPEVTIIVNVEIETRRKFYHRKMLQEVTSDRSPKRNIYNIMEQMSALIKYITFDTIRFVKYKGIYATTHRLKRPMADWWERLRRATFVEIEDTWEVEYLHFYQNKLDFERAEKATIKKVAKMAVYMEFADGMTEPKPFDANSGHKSAYPYHDFESFLSNLNDNDIMKYYWAKEAGHKEILSKLRQNALTRLKLENRPLPKLRKPPPERMFVCAVCDETLEESRMAINMTESDYGVCIECLKKSVQ